MKVIAKNAKGHMRLGSTGTRIKCNTYFIDMR